MLLRRLALTTSSLLKLLPEPFALQQARRLYESTFSRGFGVRSFSARLLASGMLRPSGTAGRPVRYELRAGADRHLADRRTPLLFC
jgi:hypothetical protein